MDKGRNGRITGERTVGHVACMETYVQASITMQATAWNRKHLAVNSERQYIDLYLQYEDIIDQGSHALINSHRAGALAALQKNGLPSLKDERFKYTDVQKAFEADYGLNVKRRKMVPDLRAAYRCSVPDLDSVLYYVYNDCIEARRKDMPDIDGLFVGSLVDFAELYPEKFKKHYNKLSPDGIVSLNTLLAQNGVVIYVSGGCKVSQNIQVVNLTVGDMPVMTNRRMMIILEDGAEASVLLCDHSLARNRHLTTEVAEIYLGKDAGLQLCAIEETNEDNNLFRTTNIVQDGHSRLAYADVTLNNGITRHSITTQLLGEGADAKISGLVIGDGAQHVDNNLLVSHEACMCKSDILYKYVLDGESKGAFAGKVYVAQGAQKSDSQETNANLCVSPKAHMYTQPMLEIYADDVKCNHGSTVGQLSEAALFYMAQRGIEPAEGRRLLQQAFAVEVIERIGFEALRNRLTRMVEERFRRGHGACGDCSLCSNK